MALATSKKYLIDAQKNKYAICGFNIHNLETLKAAVSVAEEKKSPVILQATPGTIKFAGVNYLANMAKTASDEYNIPIVMHLDHCEDFDMIIQCLRAGFTSIMVDSSKLDLKENINMVKKVVEAAHAVGVPVEAELGVIGGTEDDLIVDEKSAVYTDPEAAADFVDKTKVDSLAIAIGTAHGVYKGEPKLDFERLKKIRSMVDIPLVLHGASGVPDESIKQCIEFGINKINIATELKIPFSNGIKEFFEDNSNENDPRKFLKPGIKMMKDVIRQKIDLAGSANKGFI